MIIVSAPMKHRLPLYLFFSRDELNGVLEAIETDTPYQGAEKTQMKLGVDVLPKFNRDTTDRNKTSPFAFTGNKFEVSYAWFFKQHRLCKHYAEQRGCRSPLKLC